MNELFRELVRQRLSAAKDCPAKADIVEEITADLTEKYNELTAGGMEPEAARAQVEAGIGDLSEIVSFINEADRRTEENQKAGNSNPFAGLDEAMRQLGKAFSSPAFKAVADDLRSAASHGAAAARDVARDAREPLRNMAHSVKSSVRQAAKSLNIRFSSHGSDCRYDYTVPAEGLLGVDVQTASGDVLFGVSQDDNIYIVELTESQLTDEQLAQIQVSDDGILRIRQGQRSSAGSVLFSYGMLQSDFEIYLPRRAWNLLRVATTGVGKGHGDRPADRGDHLRRRGMPHAAERLCPAEDHLRRHPSLRRLRADGADHRLRRHRSGGLCPAAADEIRLRRPGGHAGQYARRACAGDRLRRQQAPPAGQRRLLPALPAHLRRYPLRF